MTTHEIASTQIKFWAELRDKLDAIEASGVPLTGADKVCYDYTVNEIANAVRKLLEAGREERG